MPDVVAIRFPPAPGVSRQNEYSETPQRRKPESAEDVDNCSFDVGKTEHLLDWLVTCLAEFGVQFQKRKAKVLTMQGPSKVRGEREKKMIVNGKHVLRSHLLDSELFCANKP